MLILVMCLVMYEKKDQYMCVEVGGGGGSRM